MTPLLCIDTKTGDVRRYIRSDGRGLHNVRKTHNVHFPEWPAFLRGELTIDLAVIEAFRLTPSLCAGVDDCA